ncbi:membrane metallo-endopeptidase-like 1 [Calliphora vicina]|uniref:membrane metallo-endopeptidase-like 1 n=1 Tax=Calliphora vicina TaxID=7373 RepID=UPI00325B4CE1
MKKVFKTILLIYLNISSTSLKFVQTANIDVKKPCEDFHEYVCSSNSENDVEISLKLDFKLNRKLLGYLNRVIEKRKSSYSYYRELDTYFDKIITYFEACTIRMPYFGDYLYNFNSLKVNQNSDIWHLLGIIQSYGLNNVIINHHTTRNTDNSLNMILTPVDIAKDEPLDVGNNMLLDILYAFGYEDEEAVQNWFTTSSKWRDVVKKYKTSFNTTREFNLKTFKLNYPKLQLYLKNLLETELDNLSVITVKNLDYFEFLNKYEWTVEEEKYLIIIFLYYLYGDATKGFEPLDCIKDLRNKFDLGLNYIYYHDFFKRSSVPYKLALSDMYNKITVVMTKQFKENHLNLSNKQIEYLLNKLQAVKINIGNLPDNFNFTQINTFYQDIPKLSSSNYCKNHLMLLKHRFRKSLVYTQNETYSLGTDSNTATTPSLPFYVLNKNMIVIPVASLQFPLYHYQLPPLEQLSVFGFIMAHELTHAFDTWGLQFDHQGSELLTPPDILEHANFTASVKCMREQEPTKYIHERIADLFAVRVVYRTYLEYYAEGREEDWSKKFFENLAQFFCGDNNLQFSYHDSDPVRLRQIVKNFPAFARTFQCPQDSAMNLKSKCRLY